MNESITDMGHSYQQNLRINLPQSVPTPAGRTGGSTIFFSLFWPTFANTIFLAISTDDRFRNMIFFTELGTEEAPNRGSYFIIIRRKYKQCEKSITS